MHDALIDPSDTLERQNEKLREISAVLMRRVEQGSDQSGMAYAQFERAVLLENKVRERTGELERTLDLLQDSNARLADASRQTEEAQRNLTDAIETITEGFALFDSSDRLILFNSRFCRDLTDVASTLGPGVPFGDYVDTVSRSAFLALPKGETPEKWAALRKARHTDDRVSFNVRLTGDRWLQIGEHRTLNGGTVILQTDVTDIIRLERMERDKLRDTQARMIRATLDHLNQGVCIFDEKAQLVDWNRKTASMLSIPTGRLRLGVRFSDLMDRLKDEIAFALPSDLTRLMAWAEAPGGRMPIAMEVRRAGRVLDIFGREMPDRGFVISISDVTAEREAARALHEANELLEARVLERTLELKDALAGAERANASKSRFMAAASHDLLQPLSAAKLYMSALAERGQDEDAAIVGKAQSALASAEEIIEALLDISRLDTGHAPFDIGPVRLSGIFNQLQTELEPVAAAKGLALRFAPTRAVVRSDAGYLRRIIQNLVGNAIRYTDRGKVLVGVRRSGPDARIEVWDTGPGISDEDRGVIFQEFRRLGPNASASEGLGLGLAIVERACTRLGHALDMWSVVGQGTGFFVSVPMLDTASEGRQAGPSDQPRFDTLTGAGLIVFVVENDSTLLNAIVAMMESWGVSVISASSSEEALELLGAIDITPDALLLDYQLGDDDDGITLHDTLTERLGTVPTRIVSANRSPELRRLCAERGLVLMTKPIDRARLGQFLTTVAAGDALS